MRNTISIIGRNANRRNRISLNGRQKYAAKRVAYRRAESRFKRIGDKFSVIRVVLKMLKSNTLRFFKTFKQIFASHLNSLFRIKLYNEPPFFTGRSRSAHAHQSLCIGFILRTDKPYTFSHPLRTPPPTYDAFCADGIRCAESA